MPYLGARAAQAVLAEAGPTIKDGRTWLERAWDGWSTMRREQALDRYKMITPPVGSQAGDASAAQAAAWLIVRLELAKAGMMPMARIQILRADIETVKIGPAS